MEVSAMALITRITLRNDSTANWSANSAAVLLRGEVGLEFTESGLAKMKIGDGSSAWADLPYFGGDSGSAISAIDQNVLALDLGNNLTLLGF
jgi:hypothetical protein